MFLELEFYKKSLQIHLMRLKFRLWEMQIENTKAKCAKVCQTKMKCWTQTHTQRKSANSAKNGRQRETEFILHGRMFSLCGFLGFRFSISARIAV